MRITEEMFKWKFPELVSIDFKLLWKGESNEWTENIFLTCECAKENPFLEKGKFLNVEEFKENLQQFSKEENQNIKEIISNKSVIIECSYDISSSKWIFKKIRKDKDTANFITIVQDTLQTIHENITFQFLCDKFKN